MSPRALRPAAVLLVTMLVTACGPTKPTLLSMKSIPVPILLHVAPKTSASPAAPVLTETPSTGVVVIPSGIAGPFIYAPGNGQPPSGFPAVAPGTGAACPDLSPFAVPAREATPSIAVKALTGRYAYRNSGDINGSTAPPSTHTVDGATEQDTANQQVFNFTDTQKSSLGSFSSGYRVVNAAASAETAGELDLVSMTDSNGNSVTLQPGLTLFKTPADNGVSWQSASTASSTAGATSYRISATINKRQLVNACGQAVDSWNVTATESVTGPLDNITYNLEYNVATGYGGLIVRVVSKADSGVVNGAPYSEHLTSVISQANPS